MKIWLRSSQLWVESLKLWNFCVFFQEISADQSVTSVSPEDRRCLFPEVLECNLKLSKCFISFRRGNWAATMATREEGEIKIAKSGIFCRCLLECKNNFAAQQNNTGCLPWWEQSSKICANALFWPDLIFRYLPNTDTPMCDPWAAVQFNKHQCKFLE